MALPVPELPVLRSRSTTADAGRCTGCWNVFFRDTGVARQRLAEVGSHSVGMRCLKQLCNLTATNSRRAMITCMLLTAGVRLLCFSVNRVLARICVNPSEPLAHVERMSPTPESCDRMLLNRTR